MRRFQYFLFIVFLFHCIAMCTSETEPEGGASSVGTTLNPQQVTLSLSSDPDGAVVILDGNTLAKNTPCSVDVVSGVHEVMMHREGYRSRAESVHVGEDKAVSWTLERDDAQVEVTSKPEGLGLRIDNEFAGRTPLLELRWTPGTHRIRWEDGCYEPGDMEVNVSAGEKRTIEIPVVSRRGEFELRAVDPQGKELTADVFVDERKAGETPGTFSANRCGSLLEIRHPGGVVFRGLRLPPNGKESIEVVIRKGGELSRALAFDFRQRVWAEPKAIRALYKRSCEGGDTLACEYEQWHRDRKIADFEAARPLFSRACNQGVLTACVATGWITSQDPQDPGWPESGFLIGDHAASAFGQACEQKSGPACRELGRLYYFGVGVKRDVIRAKNLFQESCDKGDVVGCTNLGFLYQTGVGVKEDPVRANRLYDKACDAGDMGACVSLGSDYQDGIGIRKDVHRANRLYHRACQGGEMLGCFNLGYNYKEGLGFEKDLVRSNNLYQLACDGEEFSACTRLGFSYQGGLGVKKDIHQANELYERACDREETTGCYQLGLNFLEGLGVLKDPLLAKAHFKTACEGGDQAACINLGYNHQFGKGKSGKDPHLANQLYREACENGEMLGCTRLGINYQGGVGVPKDVRRANHLFEKACDQGSLFACGLLDYNKKQKIGEDQ